MYDVLLNVKLTTELKNLRPGMFGRGHGTYVHCTVHFDLDAFIFKACS